MVHLGIGAFHRAHQAVFTEDAMAASGEERWAICGVSQRSGAALSPLRAQDGLYSVLSRSAERTEARVVGVLRRLLFAQEEPEALTALLAAASTRVVTLTVTEKGYRHDPSSGRLRTGDSTIRADAAGAPPASVVGQLVRGLAARRAAGGAPVAIVSCDNLPSNGTLLGGLVHDFCELLGAGAGLWEWIEENVSFPCTMVDRIVPATTEEDLVTASEMIGVRDEAAVVGEPFAQWVIEDRFSGPRPQWEAAGALLVDDVGPWEVAKLRVLNGAHSMLAYLGALAGEQTIAGAVGRQELAGAARAFLSRDVAPTLAVPAGMDLDAYQVQVLDRFANPRLRHATTQVAADGSQKLPQRLLGTIRDRMSAGAQPTLAALAVAGWMRYVWARTTDQGRPLPLDDPLAGMLAERLEGASQPGDAVRRLLGVRAIFGEDLPEHGGLVELLEEHLRALSQEGALAAARGAVGA